MFVKVRGSEEGEKAQREKEDTQERHRTWFKSDSKRPVAGEELEGPSAITEMEG